MRDGMQNAAMQGLRPSRYGRGYGRGSVESLAFGAGMTQIWDDLEDLLFISDYF